MCLAFVMISGGAGCGDSPQVRKADGKVAVAAGIPPVAWLARRVGGGQVEVFALLPEGRNPHDYSPGAGEIGRLARSSLFLSAGTAFENRLAHPLKNSGKVVDLTAGIKRIMLDSDGGESTCSNSCGDGHHHHGHGNPCSADGYDPHIWLSPGNLAVMSRNICEALCKADPVHAADYRRNQQKLEQELNSLGEEILTRLAPFRGRRFFVYHPAFGYFAGMSGLRQIAIELDGREASAARLAQVIRTARAEKAAVIFVQPQFNPASAAALARETGAVVEELDPLAGDVPANLRKLTMAICRGFVRGNAEVKK